MTTGMCFFSTASSEQTVAPIKAPMTTMMMENVGSSQSWSSLSSVSVSASREMVRHGQKNHTVYCVMSRMDARPPRSFVLARMPPASAMATVCAAETEAEAPAATQMGVAAAAGSAMTSAVEDLGSST